MFILSPNLFFFGGGGKEAHRLCLQSQGSLGLPKVAKKNPFISQCTSLCHPFCSLSGFMVHLNSHGCDPKLWGEQNLQINALPRVCCWIRKSLYLISTFFFILFFLQFTSIGEINNRGEKMPGPCVVHENTTDLGLTCSRSSTSSMNRTLNAPLCLPALHARHAALYALSTYSS